jgi:hydroxymethylbilane synthase
MADRTRIVIGTRKSRLALAQSELVAAAIRQARPDLEVLLHPIVTQGDLQTDKPLPQIGGKGLFTLELEQALLSGRIDLAVHSAKDLPTDNPEGLDILCVPTRGPVADVLVTPAGLTLQQLPYGARVGTSSLRRRLQLAALRQDLHFTDVRGNIDTRIRKVLDGQYDAVVLAQAGLIRAGLTGHDGAALRLVPPATQTQCLTPEGMIDAGYTALPLDEVLPAPGQAALAVQGRADDSWLRDVLTPVNNPLSAACLRAERLILQTLRLDCQMPFAALCEPSPTLSDPPTISREPSTAGFRMRAWLADVHTGRSLRVEAAALSVEPLVAQMVQRIEAAGGGALLEACRRPSS